MRRVILTVTNDLVSDQRVHKISTTLVNSGFEVLLVGRVLPNSKTLKDRIYQTKRFQLLFDKGVFFYAEYNIRLFFFLLFEKFDIVVANDLDTLSATFLVSKIKFKKLVYDSHEYFTEVPELVNRKTKRNIWLFIENILLPKVKISYTVCDSIAKIYNIKYGIRMQVIRNLPYKNTNLVIQQETISKNLLSALKIQSKKIIIYQGALNIGRGIETVISAMKFLDDAIFIIIGDGDISDFLKNHSKKEDVENKIIFTGKIPFEELSQYTNIAHVGISLEENNNENYFYSLPNKLFDYIQANIPVLVSDLPEMKKIVIDYNIGIIAKKRTPEDIAGYLKEILHNEKLRILWSENIKNAAKELCWENEEYKVKEIFDVMKDDLIMC